MNSLYNLNLKNLNSLVVNNLDATQNISDIYSLEIPIKLTIDEIEQFNNKIITPKNFNKIIEICDYLMIENTESFILKNSTPTEELYILSENHIINGKSKINIPEFMRNINKDRMFIETDIPNSINSLYEITQLDNPEVNMCFFAAKYGLLQWLKWGYNKYCWGKYSILIS